MRPKVWFFFALLLIQACIGVDELQDPIIRERLEVHPQQLALQPGGTHQLVLTYHRANGQTEVGASATWTSSNPAAVSVTANGTVHAHQSGQASITALRGGLQSNTIEVNVVQDENSVASVTISTVGQPRIAIGESIPLQVSVKNIHGVQLAGRVVEWFSENSSIVMVNEMGVATRGSHGVVDIHAKSEHVKSNVLTFGDRLGMFTSAGGYKAEGTAVMYVDNGELVLDFAADFETSFALGTYVYLANSTHAAQVKSSGLDLGQITSNGAKKFYVHHAKPDAGLFDYKYVVILCKPATVTFGYAEME